MDIPTSSTPLLSRRTHPLLGHEFLWRTGVIFIAAGMLTGAFGVHGLRKRSGITEDRVHAWQTAASYAIYNGLGLLAISLHPRFANHRFAGRAVAFGGLVFSGSIFALTLGPDWLKFLGPVTPLGGTLAIAGYLSLVM